MWAHLNPIILKAGRCSHKVPDGLDDEAKEEWLGKQAEADKTEERFRAINEDVKVAGSESAWLSKVSGDKQ